MCTQSVVLCLCPSFAQIILLLFQILNWSYIRGLHAQMRRAEITMKNNAYKHTYIQHVPTLQMRDEIWR